MFQSSGTSLDNSRFLCSSGLIIEIDCWNASLIIVLLLLSLLLSWPDTRRWSTLIISSIEHSYTINFIGIEWIQTLIYSKWIQTIGINDCLLISWLGDYGTTCSCGRSRLVWCWSIVVGRLLILCIRRTHVSGDLTLRANRIDVLQHLSFLTQAWRHSCTCRSCSSCVYGRCGSGFGWIVCLLIWVDHVASVGTHRCVAVHLNLALVGALCVVSCVYWAAYSTCRFLLSVACFQAKSVTVGLVVNLLILGTYILS